MNAWRDEAHPEDAAAVAAIVRSSGFFSDAEIEIAVELVQERLQRGARSGYHFLFEDDPETGRPVGYTCFGEIPCTVGSYDLYWIAVDASQQRRGLGRRLLAETERRVQALGGRRLYIETSGRELYRPTQGFYVSCGYELAAELEDFYAPGDSKLIYVKAV